MTTLRPLDVAADSAAIEELDTSFESATFFDVQESRGGSCTWIVRRVPMA